jgi:hypothetical protein
LHARRGVFSQRHHYYTGSPNAGYAGKSGRKDQRRAINTGTHIRAINTGHQHGHSHSPSTRALTFAAISMGTHIRGHQHGPSTRAINTGHQHGSSPRAINTGHQHGPSTRAINTGHHHGPSTWALNTGHQHGPSTRALTLAATLLTNTYLHRDAADFVSMCLGECVRKLACSDTRAPHWQCLVYTIVLLFLCFDLNISDPYLIHHSLSL